MPIHTNKIERLDSDGNVEDGFSYLFQDLIGEPAMSSERVEILERRGVDGVGLRALGTAPKPFQVSGFAYHDGFEGAQTGANQLRALIGHSHGIRLTVNSIDWGVFDLLGVQPQPPRACMNVVGSLIANPTVVQHYAFTMIERTAEEE